MSLAALFSIVDAIKSMRDHPLSEPGSKGKGGSIFTRQFHIYWYRRAIDERDRNGERKNAAPFRSNTILADLISIINKTSIVSVQADFSNIYTSTHWQAHRQARKERRKCVNRSGA